MPEADRGPFAPRPPTASRAAPAPIAVRDLGPTRYVDALERMRAFVLARVAGRAPGVAPGTGLRRQPGGDEIWLTEHDPVFTLGRGGNRTHLIAPGDIPVVHTERGGEVTYHGPGQVVAYLMLDLPARGLGVRRLVDAIEHALIATLADFGIGGVRRPGAPGVYVATDGAKIASIGLKVTRGISWHGLALNADMDLAPFARIDPCGYPGLAMTDVRTCLRARDGGAPAVDLKALRVALADHLLGAIGR